MSPPSPPSPTLTPPTLGSLIHSQRHSYGNFLPTPAQASHAIMGAGAQNPPAQPLQHHPSPVEASYAQFRQSFSNRGIPALDFQGQSIQRSPIANSMTNNPPTAYMYSPQSTNMFSSPPEVPRTTANLPNINIPRFTIGPPPVVNPQAFPVQPYGNVASRQYAQHQVSYAQPMRAAPSALAHMGLGVPQHQSPALYQRQVGTSQAPSSPFRNHDQILAEARRVADQVIGEFGGVAGAHTRLFDAVESDIASFPPHESASPSLSPTRLPSSPPVPISAQDGRAGSKVYPPQHSQYQELHSRYAAPTAQIQPQPDFRLPSVASSSPVLHRVSDTIHVQQQPSSSSKNAAVRMHRPVPPPAQGVPYYTSPLQQIVSLNSQRQDSATASAPMPKKIGRPRKPTNELKRPRQPRRKAANPVSSPLLDNLSLSSAHESDADAEGSADEYFDESNYQVANGIARKAPRESQPPMTRITLKLNMANTSDAKFALDPKPEADSKPVPRGRPRKYQITKPKTTRGKAAAKRRASVSPTKKALITLPPSIVGKAKPTQLEDILTLINFERDAYNANPQRQAEIEERNAQIKKENYSRNDKIRRAQQKIHLGNTPPLATRGRQAKRKVVLEEDGDDEVSVMGEVGGRQVGKNKARKTKRMGNEEVASASAPDGDGDYVMDDDATTAAASEVEEPHHTTTPAAINDTSDISFSDSEVLKPRDHLPTPHGPFHPAPNSFFFDTSGNATPYLSNRRSRRLHHIDPTPSSPSAAANGSTRKLRPRAELQDLMKLPALEKVVYEPIELPHLTKKLKESNWAAGGPGGDAEVGKLVTEVVGGDVVAGEKDLEVLLPGVGGAAVESIGVDGDGDVDMGVIESEGRDYHSEMDAEGETD